VVHDVDEDVGEAYEGSYFIHRIDVRGHDVG